MWAVSGSAIGLECSHHHEWCQRLTMLIQVILSFRADCDLSALAGGMLLDSHALLLGDRWSSDAASRAWTWQGTRAVSQLRLSQQRRVVAEEWSNSELAVSDAVNPPSLLPPLLRWLAALRSTLQPREALTAEGRRLPEGRGEGLQEEPLDASKEWLPRALLHQDLTKGSLRRQALPCHMTSQRPSKLRDTSA